MPVDILDKYYLALTVLVTTGYQLLGFAVAWSFQFDKITDFTGGSNFFLLAILTLCLGGVYHARNVIVSIFVMVWASRLAGFLLFRVLKTGSDSRFDDIRSHFFKFLGFWVGQIIWVWTVSLPVTILNSPGVVSSSIQHSFGTGTDIAGVVLWTVGWIVESVADLQKYNYKQTHPPKDQPITVGLWKYCRHPPYFGEILCWWGIWLVTLSATSNTDGPRRAQLGALASPLFTMILLIFGSGIPTAQKPTARKFFLLSHGPKATHINAWPNYQRYLARTSVLIPLPPSLYARLPQPIKTVFLLDLPMYRFNEETDGKRAIDEERQKIEHNPMASPKRPAPLALPAPEATLSNDPSITTLEVGGKSISFDKLGPMVVNSNGYRAQTLSRIANWQEMTPAEQQNTIRVLSKRNQLRTTILAQAESTNSKRADSEDLANER
ncbi:hypothetical protein CTheo_2126 [Ceratobasidium theobromae]|uniref:Uncharacterized protein n=1 Tax=Ceratobasidium theobromae TaxID=1582974 RepID=A0A5N5QRY2_9AGAM|nr:hypothetical protein CTheo_2126 [Ceratobasidium theobromae]